MELGAPIAYIDPERSVFVIDREGRHHAQSTPPVPNLVWGSWRIEERTQGSYSWPTWSPDGAQLACFRLPDEEHPTARVLVSDVGGVRSTAVADLGNRLPIYLFWSPDGEQIAILSQHEQRLNLSIARADTPDGERPLAEGSPLFFTWAGPRRVAAFVGGPGRAPRVSLLDTSGSGAATVMPGLPGNFCAPLWVGEEVVYALADGDTTRIVVARHDDAEPRELDRTEGLVAMLASPDGRFVARGVAPDGDGTPYRHLAVIEVTTGEVRHMVDKPCLAFLWHPRGDALITVSVDTQRNLLEWQLVDLHGNIDHLADLYPTRDLGFYLRFFEQYAQSHPLVDPSGTTLLLSGELLGTGAPRGTPRLWAVPLDGSPARSLGEALFGVYGPAV